MSFEHLISENCLLHHHFHHGIHLILLVVHSLIARILHHFLHGLELLLLGVEEDFLGLLLADGGRDPGGTGITTHLSLHQDLLSLRIHHVELMSLHELLLRQSDVIHSIGEEISADLLLLLNHVHDELLVLACPLLSEQLSALPQELTLFLSKALSRILHDDLEDIFVVGE